MRFRLHDPWIIWTGSALALLLTFAMSLMSFEYLSQNEQLRLHAQGAQLQQQVQARLEYVREKLHYMTTAVYLSGQQRLPHMDLREGERTIYAPLVLQQQRANFERNMQEDGLISFTIHHAQAQNSATYPRYFPITSVQPFDVAASRLLGLDLLHTTSLSNDIVRAMQSNTLVVTSAPWAPKSDHGIWFFHVTYAGMMGTHRASDISALGQQRMEMVNSMVGLYIPFSAFLDAKTSPTQTLQISLLLKEGSPPSPTLISKKEQLNQAFFAEKFYFHLDSSHYLELNMQRELPHDHIAYWVAACVMMIGILFTWILAFSTYRAMRSHQRKRSILKSSFEGILSFNQRGDLLELNPAGQSIFQAIGMDASQPLHHTLFFPGFTAGTMRLGIFLQQQSATLLNQPIELFVQQPAHNHCIECSITALDGDKTQFTMFFRDITERKRNDEELSKLATIVGQSFNGIVLTDIKGNIQYVNPAFEKMSGYTLHEVLGKNPRLVKSGKHTSDYYNKMWISLLSGESWAGIFINRAKDGHLYEVDQSIFPIYTKHDHTLLGYTAIQQDVTERNRIQRQDEHAQRLESLGVLAGGIAHDFNNLLTAILGNAELGKINLNKPEQCNKNLSNICKASESAASLCQQMLAYSGKGKFIVRKLNLSEVVANMSQLLHTSINKMTHLHLQLQHDLPLIQADEGQMQQVMMNLIINASEALEERQGDVYLTTGVQSLDVSSIQKLRHAESITAGDYVFLDVRDTGCGMDEDTLRKIFDPFFTTKFTGRGLGMSAILGIVRGHEGALDIQTDIGKGSAFRIFFPVCMVAPTTKKTAFVATQEITMTTEGTVLVVDDEEGIRELAGCILENMGLHAMYAADGEEGLRVLQENLQIIDLVLLDMTMPNLNGQQFYQRMQSFAADVPVIISSGYAKADIRERFAEDIQSTDEQHLAFVEKPYSPRLLMAEIQRLLT